MEASWACHHAERTRRRLISPPVHTSSGYTELSMGCVPEQFGTSAAALHLIGLYLAPSFLASGFFI